MDIFKSEDDSFKNVQCYYYDDTKIYNIVLELADDGICFACNENGPFNHNQFFHHVLYLFSIKHLLLSFRIFYSIIGDGGNTRNCGYSFCLQFSYCDCLSS